MARLAPAMALLLLMGADQPADPVAPVRTIAERFAGELGVFAKHLGTGEVVAWNADARFPTASVIKVAIMVEAFDQIARGTLAADAIVRVRDGAKVGGAGVARELHDGAELTVRDLIRLMIVVSDNTATNLLLERVGVPSVNARLAAYGLKDTRLFRPTFGKKAEIDPELEREFGLGMSTPRDMAALMEMIATRRAVSAGASKEMRAILESQQDARMLPRRLPFDTREIVVGNKTGTDEEKPPDASGSRGHVRADVGIVRVDDVTYVVAIFARRVKDRSWMADNAALVAGAEISRIVFDRFAGSSRQ
ncbi:MAG: serine hydrolase [Vicinamibacterales bacterium]